MLKENKKELKRTFRINRNGDLIKRVHEVYFRNDITCGWEKCEICPKTKSYFNFKNSKNLFIPDFNILKNYYDILMNSNISNWIISQTNAEFLRRNNKHLFKRFRSSVELEKWRSIYVFPNEYFEKTAILDSHKMDFEKHDVLSICKIADYFSGHFLGDVNIVVLTQDKNMQKILSDKNINSVDIKSFVVNYAENKDDLLDFLGFDTEEDLKSLQQHKNLLFNFSEHLTESELLKSIGSGESLRGKIKFGRFNKNEATIFSRALNKDIIIRDWVNLNRCIQGDIVAVKLLEKENWLNQENLHLGEEEVIEERKQLEEEVENKINHKIDNLKKILTQTNLIPRGKVIGVIKRDLRNFCGEITEIIGEFGIVSLTDGRYPDVLIKPKNLKSLLNKKIIVNIDKRPINSKNPLGHLVKILGNSEDVQVENDVILYEFGVETRKFPQRVIDCLPQEGENWKIPLSELNIRNDLREEFVCSVDPVGCKDIDDALHAKYLPNGNIEVGVHIADVTYFVKADTPIDLEAADRCTTVYLVNQRTDMLPRLLTEKLCSLVGGTERLAFSCIWEIDAHSLEIVGTKFCKSVIKSKKAFTYQQAQDVIDDQNNNSELTKGLRILLKISQFLKRKRLEQGALQLASTQVKFKLGGEEKENPTDVSYYDLLPTNSMVEEFMLLANVSVGKFILENFPSAAILRRHSSPKPERIQQLSKILKKLNFELDYTTSKSLADSLDKIKRHKDPFFNKLVRILTTRCMHEAVYFCSADFDPSEFRHYGLAANVYTHFTSPIRRYADVLVHRLLAASIGLESLPDSLCIKSKLNRVCEQMNFRNRNARNASRASSEFFSYLFFKNKTIVETAIISGIQSNGFTLIVSKYGFEGFLEFEDRDLFKNEEIREKNNEDNLISFFYKGEPFKLFDWVSVSINVDLVQYRKKITMKILKKL